MPLDCHYNRPGQKFKAVFVESTKLEPWNLVYSFVKSTSNVNGRLEDGDHHRGK